MSTGATMDLDELKKRWADQEHALGENIRLSTRLLRASELGKAETALRRLTRLLWLEVVTNGIAAVWLGSFIAAHVSDTRFLVPAAILDVCTVLLLIAGIRQLVAIRTIDYSAPIVRIQRRLESLRIERIRTTKITLLGGPLLWTPLLIVAARGLFGIDLYATVTSAWLLANIFFGVAVIVVAVWVSRRYAEHLEASSFWGRLMRHLAGKSLNSAVGFVNAVERFENEDQARS